MADANASGATPSTPENPQVPADGKTPPPIDSTVETVTLPKKEFDQLAIDAARTRSAQQEAERLRQDNLKFGKKKLEKPEFLENAELVKAKQIITAKVLANKDYQELTASNPVLAKTLLYDPSVLLDETEFFDGHDLASQVLGYLDREVEISKAAKTITPPPTAPVAPVPDAANPPAEFPAAKTEEEHKQEQPDGRRTVDRIASKLEGKIKF